MKKNELTQAIIVFPADMPESISFCQNITDRWLIGVSSNRNSEVCMLYNQWEYLPYVDTPNFNQSFLSLINKTNPKAIYCPHRFVSHYVRHAISKYNLNIKLIENNGNRNRQFRKQQSINWLEQYHSITKKLDIPKSEKLNDIELDAAIRHALSISGETGIDKIINLLAIGAIVKTGDLVEIGCLYGRTSFILSWLARRYDIGNTLCVDPWNTEAALHQDTSAMAREAIEKNYDYNAIFKNFKENLIPSFYGTLNFIKTTSNKAAAIFKTSPKIETEEFGTTQYKQSISCLHIDGNHDFLSVLDDLINWSPLLQNDGWIILDDYHWPFGDGPKRVANEILDTNSNKIDFSFIAGDALFIKFKHNIDTSILFNKELVSLHE